MDVKGSGQGTSANAVSLFTDSEVTTTGEIKIVDYGQTETGGWIEFTGTGEIVVDGEHQDGGNYRPFVIKDTWANVGGGRWVYGSTVNAAGQKACHSKYYHKWRSHTATAKMDGYASKKSAGSGGWARALVKRHTTKTCYTYWNRT